MKKLNYILTSLGVLLLNLFLSVNSYSQQHVDALISNKECIPKSQIKLLVTPTLFQRVKLNHKKQKILQSGSAPSYDFGIEYDRHIKKNIGISIGLHWAKIPERYPFTIYVPEIDRDYSANDLLNDIQYAYFPFSLSKTINFRKTNLNIGLGAALNYIHPFQNRIGYGYAIDSTFNSGKDVLEIIVENEYQKWFLSYFAKVGVSKQLKKSASTFEVNLKINYTPRLIGKGTYQFSNIPEESYGDVGLRLNYIGLEFVYGLTLSKIPKYKSEE